MLLTLNHLSKEEFQRFSKFVEASYFNSNKKLRNILKYLQSYYPEITEEDIQPSIIWFAATGESRVTDTNYRKLISDFTDLYERFLVQNEFENDKEYQEIMLLRNLRKRNCRKRFEKNYSGIISNMDAQFSKDDDYYIRRSLVISEKYQYDFAEIKHEFSPLLQEQSDNIDNLIIFEKLHLFHQMIQSSHKPGAVEMYRQEWIEEILKKVETNVEMYKVNHPNIYIIYLVLKMIRDDDNNKMKELMAYLKKVGSGFPGEKLSYYYNYLTSFCILKFNAGELMYRSTALELYKLMDKKGLMAIDGVILDSEFNNVINIALGELDLAYAEKFISKYKKKIHESYAEDAYNLAMAKLLFNKKEYDKMFDLVSRVDPKDPGYYINTKILTARAYIENNEPVRAKYIYDNLIQYSRTSKKISKDEKNSIVLFLKFLNYLLKMEDAAGSDAEGLKKTALSELLNCKQPVPAMYWFKTKFK